jgi:hypothetical protein
MYPSFDDVVGIGYAAVAKVCCHGKDFAVNVDKYKNVSHLYIGGDFPWISSTTTRTDIQQDVLTLFCSFTPKVSWWPSGGGSYSAAQLVLRVASLS